MSKSLETAGLKVLETKVYKNPSDQDIKALGQVLREGGLVAIPTETVYGLAANGLDAEAMGRIYEAKGRPSDNPLILHLASKDQVAPLVIQVPPLAQKLMDIFWPGPLTITLPKSDFVPDRATGGLDRVALRCPDHDLARAIIRAAGVPLAAPSANLSGRPSPTSGQAVLHDMDGRIEALVDAGPCSIGVESTVVEVHDNQLIILRPGGVTESMLKEVTPHVVYDKHLLGAKEAPKAPGMKYKHYAPDADMTTYVGSDQDIVRAMVTKINNILEKTRQDRALSLGLLIREDLLEAIQEGLKGDGEGLDHAEYSPHEDEGIDLEIIPLTYKDPVDLAHTLYQDLLDFNEAGVDYILAQGLVEEGLGLAIMNRMNKASAGRIIKL